MIGTMQCQRYFFNSSFTSLVHVHILIIIDRNNFALNNSISDILQLKCCLCQGNGVVWVTESQLEYHQDDLNMI